MVNTIMPKLSFPWMKQKFDRRIRATKRFVFYGKIFIAIAVVLLLYLSWTLKYGYFGSDTEKYTASQKIIQFTIPEHYQIMLVTNIPSAQVIVLDNTSTGQRIAIQRRPWPRKDRLPQGFLERFNHPGKIVEFRSTFTGLRNPLILKYGNTLVIHTVPTSSTQSTALIETGHVVPYVIVEDRHTSIIKQGMVACVYCSVTRKSYLISASAAADKFSADEVLKLIQQLQCH
jgi:hypothetical protein